MKKVVKFGGSSLAGAEQFQKVGEIIRADESSRIRRSVRTGQAFLLIDTKVTDMLLHAYDLASQGKDIAEQMAAIEARLYGDY